MVGFKQTRRIRISVTPEHSLADEAVSIQLAGFAAGERVSIHASTRDDRHRLWESHAVFRADGEGTISLAEHPPIAGGYSGIDAMGLFWTMSLDAARSGAPSSFVKKGLEPTIIHVESGAESSASGSIEIERHPFRPGTIIRDVNDDGLIGKLFVPEGHEQHPGVIVLGGSGGGLDWERAAMLSSHGYAALALAYFGVSPLPKSFNRIPLEYFQTAISLLRNHPRLRGDKLGVVGISRGGELGLLLGATFPEISAIIGIVPSGVTWQAFGTNAASPWTIRGQELPWAPVPLVRFRAESLFRLLSSQPVAFRRLYELALRDEGAVARATIPVEKIRGGVLLISGEDDQVWPSAQMSKMVMDRLAAKGFAYKHEHLCFKGAGHIFRGPYSPATIMRTIYPSMPVEVLMGGNPPAHSRAQREAWSAILEFLHNQLQS